mmetsp:Transcript_32939/g.92243  ORF Transcript_32939/g.92243 Transcript_32939/m.92243 type:complete len:351 (+) Transcript_32939:99-1151(+)|eukprot:CAMPEP_0119139554 /NCGR_PEP_ID=MMETSP1310-20130426/27696_1 /TAXON_ID=464262 /ORGANISM="Genus nov. species nov., Strain RCC2339" /LENGTH=350 /DNA_ID=CAMNT_0007130863 /DNA_START=55 /DNA_END=1107 /DNA_ORIENTATION=-
MAAAAARGVRKIGVFGGGSFGTAMAFVLASNGHDVTILARSQETVDSINNTHRNSRYVASFDLPENITASTDCAEVCRDAEMLVHAVPMQSSLDFLARNKEHIPPHVPIVSVSKGIHSEKLIVMSEVFPEALGRNQPTAFLSGPSFAKELMQKVPTALVVASESPDVSKLVQDMFSSDVVRVYTSDDVLGVELGGALKNVFAIGAGIAAGLDLGNNTIAAFVTRGCHELRMIAMAVGAKPETLSGLSGIGDLMLTCFGSLSRNRTVGYRLGQGETLEQIIETSVEVAEGIPTTAAAVKLLDKYNLDLPIIRTVAGILSGKITAKEGVPLLMRLPLTDEATSPGAPAEVKS